jgi:hypothetical protein
VRMIASGNPILVLSGEIDMATAVGIAPLVKPYIEGREDG